MVSSAELSGARSDGSFHRSASEFADRITADGTSGWPVQAGRYRLIVSRACPWASRMVIVRRLLGLEDALSMGIVDPIQDYRSWRFTLEEDNAVYQAGLASTQAAYDEAFGTLFGTLDDLETRLTDRRHLVGESITKADVRLFCTLVRFDSAYHGHFKCNRTKLTEFPALWGYARDLFQTPGFGDTVDFDHITRHYYTVLDRNNPDHVVPRGPDLSGWRSTHHRDQLAGRPFGDGTPPCPVPPGERVPASGRP